MSVRNIVILSFCATSLAGCASLSQTATDLGVNFWSQSAAKKAPCKSVASLAEDVECVGLPIEKPSEDEIIELRGRYTVENGVITAPIHVAP